ncbi:uncharacterized protein LOC115428216 isoform X2 [Sphaeramia orbicularis]|uniref:uncharacterized protein LOC115428216 isoform X2 n=1 Tax=Sphaeramia orbicularis TaxID=375764 RepID=UPI00117F4842|nr:uncharacterized protein LOC115428216 isoform X2 [Sphaeramia orbicularis]
MEINCVSDGLCVKNNRTMSLKLQMLRSLVEQRLTAAAEEIFGLVERTMVEYEEELCQTKEENQRQKQILDSVLNPQVVAHPPDVQDLPVLKEDIPFDQEEDWTSPSVDPDPEPSLMKEEQEEMKINDTEQLIPLSEFASTAAFSESHPSGLDSPQSQNAFMFLDPESPCGKHQRMNTEGLQLVESVLTTKPGGEQIINEYHETQTLSDVSRRKMVKILTADMTEKNGTSPSREVKEMYARGIITLFPNLRDPLSKNGYEHYYDAETGSGYLAWRIKTIQRSIPKERRASVQEASELNGDDDVTEVCSGPRSSKRQRTNTDAQQLVESVLITKPGGERIINEYNETQTLSDVSRRKMVKLLTDDMTEKNGTSPPREVKEMYARGIIDLFPNLRDPFSKNGYEHYYNAESGGGYLAWKIKTIQRSIPIEKRSQFRHKSRNRSETKRVHVKAPSGEQPAGGPTVRRESQFVPVTVLGEAECKDAIALMKRSADEDTVKNTMKLTFVHRRNLVLDPQQSTNILLDFPRFRDVPGLVEQDFVLMFGEDTSGRFLQRWSDMFKARVVEECRKLAFSPDLEDLRRSADPVQFGIEDHHGWDSDLSSVLMLSHLIPPTAQGRKRPGKVSPSQAEKHMIVFKQTGPSRILQDHLDSVTASRPHPHLLAVGDRKSLIQRFFVIVDGTAIPCRSNSSLAAFDELFKAHFVFGKAYDAVLHNMFTFIQTTVYNIDVGRVRESPRVAEVRARLLQYIW